MWDLMRFLAGTIAAVALVAGLTVALAPSASAEGYVSVPNVGNIWVDNQGGPEWIFFNDNQSGAEWATFRRPGMVSFASGGYAGNDTEIAANECKAADLVEAMIARYGLAQQGYFIGFSTNANFLLKAIRGEGNAACAARLIPHIKGAGIGGVTWRMTDLAQPKYYQGGIPLPPAGGVWPSGLSHLWLADGAVDNLIRQDTWNGPPTQPWGMTLPEMCHYFASFWEAGLPMPTPIVSRAITSPSICDYQGPVSHIRTVVSPSPDAHTMISTFPGFDSDDDFWATMTTSAPQPTTTTAATTTTVQATTTTTAPDPTTTAGTTTSTAPAPTTTTTAPSTTVTSPSTTTTTAPVDPVRDALVASVAAAQHALDVYDQAHP